MSEPMIDALGADQQLDTDDSKQQKPKQASILVAIAKEFATFFRSHDGHPFAIINIGGHAENLPLRSKAFKTWLCRAFYEMTGSAPNRNALGDALLVLDGQAIYGEHERHVNLRLGEDKDFQGSIYLDLCDNDWNAIEVSENGIGGGPEQPIIFYRTRGMLPLPIPLPGGGIGDLRPFLNLPGDDDWLLVLGWLLAALRPAGPFPILILTGEQGSGKSFAARVLRAIVDPNIAALRSEPREVRDLMLAARNGWVLAFDNISSLWPWLSDALCRLATGGGFGTRELYSDEEEILIDAQRPIILNGIGDVSDRPDLLDRALLITLPPIRKRKTEAELFKDLESARPKILHALLELASNGLRRLPSVKLENPPRMADFATWVVSCLGAEVGARFLVAYESNRKRGSTIALEDHGAIIEALRAELPFQGISKNLLVKLDARVKEDQRKKTEWPKTPRGLSGLLRRLAPALRSDGLSVAFSDDNRRLITIEAVQSGGMTAHTAHDDINDNEGDNYDGAVEGQEPPEDSPTTAADRPVEAVRAVWAVSPPPLHTPSESGDEEGEI